MNSAEQPFVIGITGNIGTGKSMVRKMLERLGALGIDADAMVHRALLRGSPVYEKVVSRFGVSLLQEDGEIDRRKLAALVFQEKNTLFELERLIHPAVERATQRIIAASPQPIVVVEAIKLLESNLMDQCDSIWLVDVPLEIQLERVMRSRGMTREQVLERIREQSPPELKAKSADVVINNNKDLEFTWKLINTACQQLEKNNPKFYLALKQIQEKNSAARSFRYMLPVDAKLLRRFFNFPYAETWINAWSNSVTNYGSRYLHSFTLSGYFEILIGFLCVMHQPNKRSKSLTILNSANFVIQPYYLFHQLPGKFFNISEWLNEYDDYAASHLGEAIILPIPIEAKENASQLEAHDYQKLPVDSQLFKVWKNEIAEGEAAGYNVFAKVLGRTVIFE